MAGLTSEIDSGFKLAVGTVKSAFSCQNHFKVFDSVVRSAFLALKQSRSSA